MKSIEKKFKPYNLTANPSHIIQIEIATEVYTNIEYKLPAHIKTITGVFISATNRETKQKLLGILTLCFNGQALKSLRVPVLDAKYLRDCWLPIELNDTIKRNSYMQGYFMSMNSTRRKLSRTNMKLTIYIHYQP